MKVNVRLFLILLTLYTSFSYATKIFCDPKLTGIYAPFRIDTPCELPYGQDRFRGNSDIMVKSTFQFKEYLEPTKISEIFYDTYNYYTLPATCSDIRIKDVLEDPDFFWQKKHPIRQYLIDFDTEHFLVTYVFNQSLQEVKRQFSFVEIKSKRTGDIVRYGGCFLEDVDRY